MNPGWRTSTVAALAATIRESRDLSPLPIFADALQDAGCYEPWVESLRAGTPTAEAAGYLVPDGWWEYARLGDELWDGPALTEIRRDQIVRRRAELLRLHTGVCPTCKDSGLVVVESVYGHSPEYGPCPTCPTRERWDRAKCPECDGTPGYSDSPPCRVCGTTGDLLRRCAGESVRGVPFSFRPLSFDGPLPVVTARVEEIAEEGICQRCKGHWAKCPDCSGTGHIVRPTAWLRNLPVWWEVTIEGAEPVNGGQWWRQSMWNETATPYTLPTFVFNLLQGGKFNDYEVSVTYPSPAAARQALIAAVRKWRFTSAT